MRSLEAFLVGARVALALLASALAFPVTWASPAKEQKLVASRIKGRPAKLLHQALYAKDGRSPRLSQRPGPARAHPVPDLPRKRQQEERR